MSGRCWPIWWHLEVPRKLWGLYGHGLLLQGPDGAWASQRVACQGVTACLAGLMALTQRVTAWGAGQSLLPAQPQRLVAHRHLASLLSD